MTMRCKFGKNLFQVNVNINVELREYITCNHLEGAHVTAAIWPCIQLFKFRFVILLLMLEKMIPSHARY